MRLVVWEDTTSQDPSQRQIDSYEDQKSYHSYNRPIFTAIKTYPQDDDNNVDNADNATIVDESILLMALSSPF